MAMDTTFPTRPQRNANLQAYGLLMTLALVMAGLLLVALGIALFVIGLWQVAVPLTCAGVGLLR
jgi:hypothetical protein